MECSLLTPSSKATFLEPSILPLCGRLTTLQGLLNNFILGMLFIAALYWIHYFLDLISSFLIYSDILLKYVLT